jgi:hypothetical protein
MAPTHVKILEVFALHEPAPMRGFEIADSPRAACCFFNGLVARATLFLLIVLLCGCTTSHPISSVSERPFVFQRDSFAFANELVWEYHVDPLTGKTTHARRQPASTYTHHCFVVARSARQFFDHARFDPARPVADEAAYRRLIRQVISISPHQELSEAEKIIIPGYENLYAFSQAQEQLLKRECGGAWQSYFQCGHWRMIVPLSRPHQERMAQQLAQSLKGNRPPVVHVVRFPSLRINHALLLFGLKETDQEIQFTAYDPNNPSVPTQLVYDRRRQRFNLPANPYFAGGRVDVYEIYHAWNY